MEKCPDCNATVENGVQGCMELFYSTTSVEYTDFRYSSVSFFTTDAHCLQHPEKHGKKNNGYHLSRLCWVFEFNGILTSNSEPKWLQSYFSKIKEYPILEPPEFKGEMNISNLVGIEDIDEYKKIAKEWAYSTYQAWSVHHQWAKELLNRIRPR